MASSGIIPGTLYGEGLLRRACMGLRYNIYFKQGILGEEGVSSKV